MIRARCEILSARKAGLFLSVTIVAPEIAEKARPGQFIQVAAPEGRQSFLRRPFFVHQTSRRGGWAGTLEFVVDPSNAAMEWLAELKPHQFLDVIGPLGKPFAVPRKPVSCLLVCEDHGVAPLYFLAEELAGRGHRVDMVIGAATQDRVFKPIEGKRLARTIAVVTEDGSAGEHGTVADVLESVVEKCHTEVVYAAGPRRVLQVAAEFCRQRSIPAQVAIEERMACGIGLCWTCVVPVARRDGHGFDNVRACVDGPAMNAGKILWDRWGAGEAPPPPREPSPALAGWTG
ncbi:MAG: dihydroorotate dehydrogenase electron transfer subunit [Actinomycetota bacterium]